MWPYRTSADSHVGDSKAFYPRKEIRLRQLLRSKTDEGLVDLIVGLVEGVSVEVKECEHTGSSGTLISIEERLVLCDEETVGRSLQTESWICIFSECALLRLKHRRFQ